MPNSCVHLLQKLLGPTITEQMEKPSQTSSPPKFRTTYLGDTSPALDGNRFLNRTYLASHTHEWGAVVSHFMHVSAPRNQSIGDGVHFARVDLNQLLHLTRG